MRDALCWVVVAAMGGLLAACETTESATGGGGGKGDCTGTDCDSDAGPQPAAWEFETVYGVANADDDNGDGALDWDEGALSPAENDLSVVTLPMAALEVGDLVELSLSGDAANALRIWLDGTHVLGESAGLGPYRFTPAADTTFEIEFGTFDSAAELSISRLSASGAVQDSNVIGLVAAPLILNHHLQPAEHVYATEVPFSNYNNDDFIATYESVLGSKFTKVSWDDAGGDVWMQDELEFATITGDEGQRIDIAIDSIRDRGLNDFVKTLRGKDAYSLTWGDGPVTSYDSFGNLEASPPVTVDGVEYPFGRIYYGRIGDEGIDDEFAAMLAAQEVQAPFGVDTTWLCVGHVDEFSSFVPDPSSPKGFKLLIANVDAAWTIIDSLAPNRRLPLYGADKGYRNVGDVQSDTGLRNLNAGLQQTYLDTIEAKFKLELGLTDADIIHVPSLFETVADCGGAVAAFMPGMVNLILANDAANQTHMFVPNPFFSDGVDDDPIADAFVSLMPNGMTVHLVDDWDVYHMGLGEVHCGTNVRRTPLQNWWETATHLMEGL